MAACAAMAESEEEKYTMYKVMLLDDEPWELRGMKNMIPWEKHGFQVVYTLSNPLEALDILKKEPVDVLLSDIRMPAMDGISLMKKLREQNIWIEILFLSGYAEFDYAREALRSGAFDYLLKPLDLDNIETLLNRLKERLEEKEHLHTLYLMEQIENGALSFASLFPESEEDCLYQVLMGDSSFIPVLTETADVSYCLLPSGPSCAVCFLKYPRDFDFMNHVQGKQAGFPVGISLTASKDSGARPECLSQLMFQAFTAYHNSFLTGSCGICLYYETDQNALREAADTIIALYQSSDSAGLKNYMNQLPGYLCSHSINLSGLVRLWNTLMLHCLSDKEAYEESCMLSAEHLLEHFSDLKHLCSELECLLESGLCPVSAPSSVDAGSQDLYSSITQYVKDHYREAITLQDVADHAHVSFTYASKLFKRYADTNYSKYLTGLRIEEACRLLSGTDKSTEQICFEIGYQDYFYFNKIFKKQTGLTPLQYRKQEVSS